MLGRYGLALAGVVDTLKVSRRLRGTKLAGGHSLKIVWARELGVQLGKSEQVSDWSQRPLSERQLAYAALDAEVLLKLFEHFGRPRRGGRGKPQPLGQSLSPSPLSQPLKTPGRLGYL